MVTGALRPLSSTEAYKLEALSESYQRHVGDTIQRQQSSGLSTPLLSSGSSSTIKIRRAKSGRRLVNQDKSKSFTSIRSNFDGRGNDNGRRAAPASVEHLMYASSSKTSSDNDVGSSRQPWKSNGGRRG
jgi:hypothetical protein